MCSNKIYEKTTIQEKIQTNIISIFALVCNRWSWIPGIGLIIFFILVPIALFQFGKGQYGFYLVRKAFVKVVFLSVLPIILLGYWAGLPEKCYPDILFGKHGKYSQYADLKLEDHFYRLGILFRKIKYYDNSSIKEVKNLNDGKLHGQYTLYHENGQKKLQILYKMDSFDGYHVAWYENGQKEFEGKYKDNRYSGTWNGWYENGQQSWTAQYNEEGKQIGKYAVWHEDGKIALEGQFENGEEVGKWTCYKKDGSIDWQTKDYKSGFERNFNSSNDYEILTYTVKDNYTDALGSTPSKQGVVIHKNVIWGLRSKNIKTESKFKLAIDELRRKHVVKIEFDDIGDKYSDIWLSHLKGINLISFYCDAVLSNTSISYLMGIPLKGLYLNGSKITDLGLYYLRFIPLTELAIIRCDNVTNKGLYFIKDIALKTLYIRNCSKITNDGLKNLKNMALENLDIRNINITDTCILYFKNMPLKTLCLPSITDKGLSIVRNIPLTKLRAELCDQITDEGLKQLQNTALRELYLSNCLNITDKGLAFFLTLPLNKLSISNGVLVTDKGLSYVKNLPLEDLNISNCSMITDDGLKHLQKMSIKSLDLSNCKSITDAGLFNLKYLPLEVLKISNDVLITDKGLSFIKSLPLKELNISGCPMITDAGLKYLQKMSLENLDLSNSKITNRGLFLIKNLPIKILSLENCLNITDTGISYLNKLSLNELNLLLCDSVTFKYQNMYIEPEEIKQMLEEVSKKVAEENKNKTTEPTPVLSN